MNLQKTYNKFKASIKANTAKWFTEKQPQDTSKPIINSAIILGSVAIAIFFGSFLLWSALIPLESAAVAPGKVIVSSDSKEIQHLEGGIVKKLFVDEGSKVKAGQPLIELDSTEAKAHLDILSNQLFRLLASEGRLIAERDNSTAIAWPTKLLESKNNPEVEKNMQVQQALFDSDRKTLEENLKILQQRIVQIKKQIEAYQAQVVSEATQLELMQEELAAYAYLDVRHLVEKPRYLAAKRQAAQLIGDRGEHLGLIAQAQEKIGETEQQIIALKQQYLQKALDDLEKVQSDLAEVLQQQLAAQDIYTRTLIKSPVSGTVIDLTVHHAGAVILPGKTFMTIVPNQDKLIVEAEVSPLDIDVVHVGLTAKVRLIAYKQRTFPPLYGKVVLVSADSILDPKTGNSHYVVRVVIDKKELEQYPNIKLYPGMPVQVMIIVEKRTPLRYFIQPIIDSFQKAFREQ